MLRQLPALLTAGCLLLGSAHAAAEQARTDPAAAEVLFDEGRSALDAGDYETACSKFAESQRLDPGAGTLMNWATCEEKVGRIASAWQHFNQALDTLRPGDDREEFARTRAAELEGRLPRLVLHLQAPVPAGTVVLRDGVILEAASLGSALPVDPGARQIIVRAPGHRDAQYKLTIAEREERELTVRAGPQLPKSRAESSTPVLGWTLVGLGAAGVGTGIVTSFLVESEQGVVDDHCEAKQCDATGLAAAERGDKLLWVNAAAYGVGAVALGTGMVLVLSHGRDKPRKKERPNVSAGFVRGGAVLGYRGIF